jgi:hypothetical protein
LYLTLYTWNATARDGSTCRVTTYLKTTVPINGAADIIFNPKFGDASCDMKNPCMHLGDGHCMPKTVNSAILVGDAQHRYWDRDATAEEQPNWQYGTWDVEGRLSRSIETQYEDGNDDCYCSAGTVDVSRRVSREPSI